jgi:hypothetical protein
MGSMRVDMAVRCSSAVMRPNSGERARQSRSYEPKSGPDATAVRSRPAAARVGRLSPPFAKTLPPTGVYDHQNRGRSPRREPVAALTAMVPNGETSLGRLSEGEPTCPL